MLTAHLLATEIQIYGHLTAGQALSIQRGHSTCFPRYRHLPGKAHKSSDYEMRKNGVSTIIRHLRGGAKTDMDLGSLRGPQGNGVGFEQGSHG